MSAALPGAAATAAPDQQCVASISASSDVPSLECYATFAEAIAAASGGRLQLDPSTPVRALTQQEIDTANNADGPLTSVIIGIDYTGSNFTGTQLTWTESSGCGSYSASSMPTGWNDVIKSVQTFSGCATTLYQNTNFGGSTSTTAVNSSSSDLGSFDSQASSEKWCTSSAGC